MTIAKRTKTMADESRFSRMTVSRIRLFSLIERGGKNGVRLTTIVSRIEGFDMCGFVREKLTRLKKNGLIVFSQNKNGVEVVRLTSAGQKELTELKRDQRYLASEVEDKPAQKRVKAGRTNLRPPILDENSGLRPIEPTTDYDWTNLLYRLMVRRKSFDCRSACTAVGLAEQVETEASGLGYRTDGFSPLGLVQQIGRLSSSPIFRRRVAVATNGPEQRFFLVRM